jgi:ankyrin repeat protein
LYALLALLAVAGLGATRREVPLVAAVRQADTTTVRALLQQHVDVNAPEADGATALHWAVHQDDLATVDLLLHAGAHVTATTRYGVTPLMLACTNGNVAIVERLLNAGADPNSSFPGGETALMTAARTGNAEVLKLVLAHRADVNARERTRGQTALMWAAAQGNTAAIVLLIGGAADIHARSHGPKAPEPSGSGDGDHTVGGRQPRSGAGVSDDQLPGLNDMTSGDYRRLGRVDEYTPLLFAVRAGHLETVRALLDAGANVNDAAPDGTSALVVAAINAHWELGALLLDRGANPNAAAQGWTPLHQVVRTRTLSIGQFPHPVPTGRLSGLDLAKKLIERGADVNARLTKDIIDGYRNRFNRIGATPLMLAAKGADAEMIRLLAAHRGDHRLTTVAQATPLMAAAGIDMFYVNEDSGTNEDAVEAVKVLLDLGSDVNAANDRGDTALHGAAARGSNPIVQMLVDNGAKLDAKNKRGFTPLNVANAEGNTGTFQRRPETVALFRELMIARGFSIDESAFVSPTVRGTADRPSEPSRK